MTMVCVPGGSFQMGSEEGHDDEQPVHTVTLDAFWLDQTEVTNAQYQQCVAAGHCEASSHAGTSMFNGDAYPVEGVSWHDAVDYCSWAGGQLPSEAQWEYAARGPEALVYPWGNDWREAVANCDEDDCKDGYETTAPVGSFPEGASWVGAQDMAGNVWEWVADWYAEDYYSQAPENNPPGPTEGQSKALRGGAWLYDTNYLRSASRVRDTPSNAYYDFGFRCLLPQPQG
jgi:formylglycine-generating enzyme required for sulfatase activity